MDNDNYNDIDYEEFRKKEHGPVFRIFKRIALGIVGVLCLLLFARIYINNTVPQEAKKILWDERAYEVYSADPEGFKLVAHPLDSYVIKETGEQVIRNNMTADAYFSFSDVSYSESADQVQLTLRYNVSTLERVKDDLELGSLPDGEVFTFVLEDDAGNRYGEYAYTCSSKGFLGKPRYQYRRLLFSDIDLTGIKTMTLKVYYVGKTEADDFIDEIIIYDKEYENAMGSKEQEFTPPDGITEGLIK